MTTPSQTAQQFRARGLSGWHVLLLCFLDGRPIPGRKAHALGCRILDEDREVGLDSPMFDTEVAPVAVEEVPQGTQPCLVCGGGALRRWRAGARP